MNLEEGYEEARSPSQSSVTQVVGETEGVAAQDPRSQAQSSQVSVEGEEASVQAQSSDDDAYLGVSILKLLADGKKWNVLNLYARLNWSQSELLEALDSLAITGHVRVSSVSEIGLPLAMFYEITSLGVDLLESRKAASPQTREERPVDLLDNPEDPKLSHAYYDNQDFAWHCAECDAVLDGDGDCPRCDADESDEAIPQSSPEPNVYVCHPFDGPGTHKPAPGDIGESVKSVSSAVGSYQSIDWCPTTWCYRCGAVVWTEAIHDTWHLDISKHSHVGLDQPTNREVKTQISEDRVTWENLESVLTEAEKTKDDAWKQMDDLRKLHTREWQVRNDLNVIGQGLSRTVALWIVPMKDGQKQRIVSIQRNVRTMRELAQALNDACDFVEKSNPKWAGQA